MQTSQLFINDHPIDLPSDSLIALSYAVNTLTDLKTVQGNISNTITLPNTANNRAALGYPEDINFNGAGIIRSKLSCRYIQNGVDVIPQGNLRITGASKTGINVVLSCGNTDFFDLITGKITELDMHEYDHTWNQATAIATRANTDGFVYPIINYGNLANNDGTIYSSVINAHQMRPAVYAKYIVRKIVQSAGYTLIDNISADTVTRPIYQNLLLPFSGDKMAHSKRYLDNYATQNMEVRNKTTLFYNSNRGQNNNIPFPVTVSGGSTFTGINWVAGHTVSVNSGITFNSIRITRGPFQSDDGCYLKLVLKTLQTNGSFVFTPLSTVQCAFTSGNDQTYTNVTLSAQNIFVNPGDELYCEMDTGGNSNLTSVFIGPDAIFTVNLTVNDVQYGEEVQLEGTLPDMACTDFLKFISFLFCAIIQTDNVAKTVTMVPFSYIKQQMPLAIDWSSRVTEADEDYDVQIGDYYQQNEAKWQHDDTVSPDTYGNGSFLINDYNLDIYQDIYDIPFAASFETPVLGNLRTLFINKIPDRLNGDMVTQTQQRVCLLNTTNTTINYQAFNGDAFTTITTAAPLTYFAGVNGAADLTMASIFANHYGDFITVLNDQRKLTCYLCLTEMDIQQLDFFKPIYIQKYASYFYISKITDYTGVKPCKVELIRL